MSSTMTLTPNVSRLLVPLMTGLIQIGLLSAYSHAAPAGWNLTFSDEFDGTEVDTAKWDPITWINPHNNELQAYHPSRVTVSDGNLVLTADDNKIDFSVNGVQNRKNFSSGKVESKFTQQYGRWEIRAKLPGTQGTWPAIWLLPDTDVYSWPSQGEIDILENRGNEPNLTSSAFHWGPDFFGRQFRFDEHQATNGGEMENFHDEFHTYAVEWDTTKLRFFVDGVNHYTLTNAETANGFYPGGFLSQQTAPMELNLNVAVGGDFLPNPNGSSVWPQQMLIDYVRVYERDENPPPVVFQNGSFEAHGGSFASWRDFGNSILNVQTHHEASALDGTETLKLYGEFQPGTTASGVQQGISVSAGDSISATASALVRAEDDLVGENVVVMTVDYYSEFGGEFGSSSYLGSTSSPVELANASTANDVWVPHTLTDTVPAGAVEARLALVFVQPGLDGGAVHIDNVSFTNLDLELNADANNDNKVDGADFLAWQKGLGQDDGTSVAIGDFNYDGVVDGEDLAVWKTQANPGQLAALIHQIPEPSTFALLLVLLLGRSALYPTFLP